MCVRILTFVRLRSICYCKRHFSHSGSQYSQSGPLEFVSNELVFLHFEKPHTAFPFNVTDTTRVVRDLSG